MAGSRRRRQAEVAAPAVESAADDAVLEETTFDEGVEEITPDEVTDGSDVGADVAEGEATDAEVAGEDSDGADEEKGS